MNNARTTQTATAINSNEAAMPSITIQDNATIRIENSEVENEYLYELVTVEDKSTGDLVEEYTAHPLPPAKYAQHIKLAEVIEADEVIVPKAVSEYTLLFKKAEECSAREILAMCRIVYEASKSLDSALFNDFCNQIGYKDDSSAIRKQIVIGKLQPRLINHAEALPATWTGIYMITQIPAQIFENMMHGNQSFKDMPSSRIQALVKETRDLSKVNVRPALLTLDEKKRNVLKGTVVAKIYFNKMPDDLDWKAFEKAMREVQANLPLQVQFTTDLQELFSQRKLQRYESVKATQAPQVFQPETWEMGQDVAAMRTATLNKSEPASNDAEKTAA